MELFSQRLAATANNLWPVFCYTLIYLILYQSLKVMNLHFYACLTHAEAAVWDQQSSQA
jgi:hypothetical protein